VRLDTGCEEELPGGAALATGEAGGALALGLLADRGGVVGARG